MSNFVPLDPISFSTAPFDLIGKKWMLITAEKDGKVNTMTASWGGIGVLWRKNVVFIFVRHSRYTHEFVEAAQSFSCCFFRPEYRDKLSLCGTVSGRDQDKIKNCGFTVEHYDGVPYFAESSLTLICKKLYSQDILKENFIDKEILTSCYGDDDMHTVYVGEITAIDDSI